MSHIELRIVRSLQRRFDQWRRSNYLPDDATLRRAIERHTYPIFKKERHR